MTRKLTGALSALVALAGSIWLLLVVTAPSSVMIEERSHVVLPIKLGEIGPRLVELGVTDPALMRRAARARGQDPSEVDQLFFGDPAAALVVTPTNALSVQDLFWGWGLANRNELLLTGRMAQDGDPARFASVGGWTPARGRAIDHYAKHRLVTLTAEQQRVFARVARGVYRPCCDNPADFPDCNHGMAMFGVLQILASRGATASDLYRTALHLNTLWFPEQYGLLKRYMRARGLAVGPDIVLAAGFSSASGFARIRAGAGSRP